MSDNAVQMNPATDYVHTHIINSQEGYNALMIAIEMFEQDRITLQEARDEMADMVESNWEAMYLDIEDWDNPDVDYAAMIQFEMENK